MESSTIEHRPQMYQKCYVAHATSPDNQLAWGYIFYLGGTYPLMYTDKATCILNCITGFVQIFQGQIQAFLRVIFKIFQHLIAGVKCVYTGIYILMIFSSLFITIMHIVLCCKHLKLCFIIAKT